MECIGTGFTKKMGNSGEQKKHEGMQRGGNKGITEAEWQLEERMKNRLEENKRLERRGTTVVFLIDD